MVLFIIIFISWVKTNSHSDNIKKLRRKLIRAQSNIEHLQSDKESIPYEVITHLAELWNLDYDERITIYRYAEDSFIPVGRYSANKELGKWGRSKYSKNVGFISKSWHKGEYFIDNLPDYTTNRKQYLHKVSQKSGMTKKDLQSITMQSRTYFCKNLPRKNPIAVIVIESRNPTLPVESQQLQEDLNGVIGKILINVIQLNLPLMEEENISEQDQ